MILANARVILPDREIPRGWVQIRDGEIVAVGEGSQVEASNVLDLGGDWLAPGFIDLHVHGGGGRAFMEGTDEAFTVAAHHHLGGGTTALAPTSVTAAWPDVLAFVSAVARWREERRAAWPRVLGAHLEGPFLSAARAGAQESALFVDPAPELISALTARSSHVSVVTLAPERGHATAAIAALVESGISVSLGHSDAWEAEVHAAITAGATRATHLFNAMSSARRQGPYRVAGLLECALVDPRLTVELIADGHHVAPTLLALALAATGDDRILLISDAIAAAGLPEGTRFRIGGREAVINAGVGMLADGSALAGSASRLIDGIRTLVRACGTPVWRAVRFASFNPARAARLPDAGMISPGRRADLVRLDHRLEVRTVWLAGKQVAGV